MATKDDLLLQRIDDLRDSTDSRLDSIDANLAEHMKQTMLVRIQNAEIVKQTIMLSELHKDNQNRIETLEQPAKALRMVKKVVLYFTSFAGAVLVTLKVLEKL